MQQAPPLMAGRYEIAPVCVDEGVYGVVDFAHGKVTISARLLAPARAFGFGEYRFPTSSESSIE